MRKIWIFAMLLAFVILLIACKENDDIKTPSMAETTEETQPAASSADVTTEEPSAAYGETTEIAQSSEEQFPPHGGGRPPHGDESGERPEPPFGHESGDMPMPPQGDISGDRPFPPYEDISGERPEPPFGDNSRHPEPPFEDNSDVPYNPPAPPAHDDSSVTPPVRDDSSTVPPANDDSSAPDVDSSAPDVDSSKPDVDSSTPVDDSSEQSAPDINDIDGGTVITSGGEHVLKGNISCPVVVQTTEKVTLVLQNATLKATDGPAIYIMDAKKVEIQLVGVNTIADGATYATDYAAAKAALFSEDSLVFSGSGSLSVTGNAKHAIACDDDIVMEGGEITVVSAATDAVHVNDSFKINGGKLTVKSAASDGIQSEAFVVINDGTLDITATGDGIKASNTTGGLCDVSISGGSVKIVATGDGIQSDGSVAVKGGKLDITTNGTIVVDRNDGPGGGGNRPGRPGRPGEETSQPETTEDTNASSKGIKAATKLSVSGGTLVINSTDDSIHSNDTVSIFGGTLTLSTSDDGIHGDLYVLIDGGKISLSQSYEGVEGKVIEINSGDISLKANDDGINASSGNGESMRAEEGVSFTINGGNLYVNAGGDGLDSNGTLTVNGGFVSVDGPTSGGNGMIDSNGTQLINGGALLACGSGDMLELPAQSSKQCTAVITGKNFAAGTSIAITDKNGNVLLCYTFAKRSAAITFSVPELVQGGSYTLYTGVTPKGTLAAGGLYYGDDVSFSGGSTVTTFTQSSVVTRVR